MALTDFAKDYIEKMGLENFLEEDPELREIFVNFAYDEVINMPLQEDQERIDDKTRFMAILAVLLGCQGVDEFKVILPTALNMGVTPVEAKEIIYQAVAYLGLGRVMPFIEVANEVLKEKGVTLPLPPQSTTSLTDSLEKGNQIQINYFGENMKETWKSAPIERSHINYWLADNCFGDYYTRTGLTDRQREMITFCYILAQGGCEPQLLGHAKGNMNVGNDRLFLIQLVSQLVPYIGYPRSLNALSVIDKASE